MIESFPVRRWAICFIVACSFLMLQPAALMAFTPVQPVKNPTQSVHQSVWFSMHQASRAIRLNQPDQAIIHLKKAVNHDPKQLIAHYLLAETAYELSGKTVSTAQQNIYRILAETHFEKTFYLNPRVLSATLKLGKLAMTEKRYDDAERYYSRALQVLPNSAVLHFNLANVYDEQSRYELAVTEYNAAIDLDPSFIYAYNNVGLVYEMMGEYPKAVEAFHHAIKQDPSYNFARLNLGQAYLKMNNNLEAERLFTAALEYEPDNPWAYLYLGNLHVQNDSYTQAAQAYQSAIERAPTYAPTYYLLAAVLHKQQRYEESLKFGKLYLKLSPQGLYAKQAMQLVQFLEAKRLAQVPEKI